MVVVPALTNVAVALPFVPLIVATAKFEELHLTGPSINSPLSNAVNCKLELLSCRGLLGETDILLAADAFDEKRKTSKRDQGSEPDRRR
jgi:hypothetical protein